MDDSEFNKKLQKLIDDISKLPTEQRDKIQPMVKETKERHEDIKSNMGKIAKSIDNLRLCIQYIMFDLEATRRERDELRDIIDREE